jgi:hypothetical protein
MFQLRRISPGRDVLPRTTSDDPAAAAEPFRRALQLALLDALRRGASSSQTSSAALASAQTAQMSAAAPAALAGLSPIVAPMASFPARMNGPAAPGIPAAVAGSATAPVGSLASVPSASAVASGSPALPPVTSAFAPPVPSAAAPDGSPTAPPGSSVPVPTSPADEAGTIASHARREAVDERFLRALRRAENGRPGREFGVLSVPAPTFDDQARIAAGSVRRSIERFEKAGGRAIDPATGRYTDEFIRFFSARWAPVGAANDPTGLNRYHARNLARLYAKASAEG